MAEALQVAVLLFGGILLLHQGALYLGLHNTDLPGLVQLVVASSLFFSTAL